MAAKVSCESRRPAETMAGTHLGAAAAASLDDIERLQLMAAAEQVLARGGWWGFKLRSVLRQAQLSTRSFYRHFDGKDGLLAALLEGELLAIAEYLRLLCDDTYSAVERVWLYIEALIDLAFDQRIVKPASLFAVHWRKLLPRHAEIVERCTQALTAPLVDALDDARHSRALVCEDPTAEAKAIFFLISSTVFDRPHTGEQDSRALVECTIISLVARALQLQPRRPASRHPRPVPTCRAAVGPAGLEFTLAKCAWDLASNAS